MPVFFSLRAQYENLGDEVINMLLLRELLKRQKVVAFTSGVPSWYLDNLLHGLERNSKELLLVEQYPKFLSMMIRSGCRGEASWFFTSCGDVTPAREQAVRDGLLTSLQLLPSLRMAMVGVSLARVTTSRARMYRSAQARGGAVTVRDSQSQTLLSQRGAHVSLVPDLAFLLPLSDLPSKTKLIISMREVHSDCGEKVLKKLHSIYHVARRQGLAPYVTWQVARDEDYCRTISQKLGAELVAPAATATGRLGAQLDLYDHSAVVVSNRLHVLLLAASRGARPIALLHRDEVKVRSIFTDSAMAEQIINLDVTGEAAIERAVTNDHVKDVVSRTFKKNSRELTKYFDRVLGPAIGNDPS